MDQYNRAIGTDGWLVRPSRKAHTAGLRGTARRAAAARKTWPQGCITMPLGRFNTGTTVPMTIKKPAQSGEIPYLTFKKEHAHSAERWTGEPVSVDRSAK